MTLIVGAERQFVKAHKAILRARSKFFRDAFEAAENPSEIRLELGERPAIIKVVLTFLYSGIAPKTLSDVAVELLPVAWKYGLSELKFMCVYAIRGVLSADNVVDVLLAAHGKSCGDLFKRCIPLIKANAQALGFDSREKLKSNPELLMDIFVDSCA